MGQAAFDWKSFWDITTPEETARILAGWYGSLAARLAAECALVASGDGRDEDYRFWYAVFARLRAEEDGKESASPYLESGT